MTPEKPFLTKAGQPRKSAAGRPVAGRTAVLPRVLPETKARLQRLARSLECSLTEAIDVAAGEASDRENAPDQR